MDTNKYKDILEAEKRVVEQELDSIGIKKNDSEDWDPAPSDRGGVETRDEVADRLEDLDEHEAAEVPLEGRLREINRALEKIENGTYGKCEIGEEDIEDDRLEANPAARTCKNHINDTDSLPPLR